MKPAVRARLAAVRAGATAGEWIYDRNAAGAHVLRVRVPAGEGHLEVPVAWLSGDAQDERNAICVCASVNAVPGLLETLSRLEAEVLDARRERDDARGRAGVFMHERDVARRDLAAARVELAVASGDVPPTDVTEGIRALATRAGTLERTVREYAAGHVGAGLARIALSPSGADHGTAPARQGGPPPMPDPYATEGVGP